MRTIRRISPTCGVLCVAVLIVALLADVCPAVAAADATAPAAIEGQESPSPLPDMRRHDEMVDSEEELNRHNAKLVEEERAKRKRHREDRAKVHDEHIAAHEEQEPSPPLRDEEHHKKVLRHAGSNPDTSADLVLLGLVLGLPVVMVLVWYLM